MTDLHERANKLHLSILGKNSLNTVNILASALAEARREALEEAQFASKHPDVIRREALEEAVKAASNPELFRHYMTGPLALCAGVVNAIRVLIDKGPQDEWVLWMCACGGMNRRGNVNCAKCGNGKPLDQPPREIPAFTKEQIDYLNALAAPAKDWCDVVVTFADLEHLAGFLSGGHGIDGFLRTIERAAKAKVQG